MGIVGADATRGTEAYLGQGAGQRLQEWCTACGFGREKLLNVVASFEQRHGLACGRGARQHRQTNLIGGVQQLVCCAGRDTEFCACLLGGNHVFGCQQGAGTGNATRHFCHGAYRIESSRGAQGHLEGRQAPSDQSPGKPGGPARVFDDQNGYDRGGFTDAGGFCAGLSRCDGHGTSFVSHSRSDNQASTRSSRACMGAESGEQFAPQPIFIGA